MGTTTASLVLVSALIVLCLEAVKVYPAIISGSDKKRAKFSEGSARSKDKDDDIVINTAVVTPNFTWTKEKMLAAGPVRFPVLRNLTAILDSDFNSTSAEDISTRFKREELVEFRSGGSSTAWSDDDLENAQAQSIPSLSRDAAARLGIKPQAPSVGAVGGATLLSSKMLRPRTRIIRPSVNEKPYNAMGRLFFSDDEGNHYTCSGQYVSESVVLTAAHCVYDVYRQSFNRDFVFVQQYEGGGNTGTKRTVKHQLVYKGWYQYGPSSPQFPFDFAFLAMNEPTATGSYLEMDTADGYNRLEACGYPSNVQHGKYLASVRGVKGDTTDSVVEMLDNPMGEGCSGGAWLGLDGGAYKTIGVNSFSIEGESNMYSPRLQSDRTQKMLAKAVEQAAK